MLDKLLNTHKKGVGLCLTLSLLLTNFLPIYAEIPSSSNDGSGVQTFKLNNTRINASNDIYKNILITEKPIKLVGTLKFEYKAYNYTIQNNSPDIRHIQALNSEDGLKALKIIHDERKPYVAYVFAIPIAFYCAGTYTLLFPIISQADYTRIPIEALDNLIHKPEFGLAIAPITTPIGIAGLAAAAATTFPLIPVNYACVAVASIIANHDDKLSIKQLQALKFEKSGATIELKPGEKVNFAIITMSKELPTLVVN